ncbi:choline binding-anchored murein hydrolase LytC [Streptococcus pneumoniae]|uniref:choline binding-anchored murein hydrolase LytC n=1 Tax=Streptococcus pneumoniae TaxID=1313 RepID=UPI000768CF7A|nr:choline binding-anchored murein hydrolase LytC [Streptococcus pneumoniae]CZD46550.1 1%2C4-beta-N-acetylmuramidase [Streptococcus pneumoniae]
MSVTFFIGEQRLKTKIGLASICLLGLATSHVAANETEVAKTSQDTTTASSSSEQNQSSNKTQTSTEVQTNAAAHWDGDYYVKDDGSKAQSEWIFDNYYKAWFYINSDGRYSQNEWHGNYYLKSGGYMAQNEWIYDSNYKSWFYLKSDGAYAHQEWQLIGNKWYYFKKWGYMARNEWQGNYYLTGSGAMATDEVIMDGARYIFAASGELKEKKDLNVGWVHRDGKRYFFNNREEQVGTEHAKKIIDISEHNGRINDWKKVIDENEVDGVIVRLGYSGKEDKELAHNIKELNRLGIPYGVYLYTYAENETDAENDAKQTIELIKKYNMNLSYPIYYDVENWEYVNKSKRAPSDTDTWVKIINKYMDTMKQAGYQNVYVYSYRSLLQTRLKHPDILKHVNWVAAYTNALEWENPYYSGEKGWQYTSSEYMKGIQGRVDVSVWY